MMAKFDSTQAWHDAKAMLLANREVLLIVAGVFFLLPSLALNLIVPEPPVLEGLPREEAFNRLMDYQSSALPYVAGLAIFQMAGLLALLRLMADRSRPTVAEALRSAGGGLPTVLAGQLVIGAVLLVVLSLVLGFATLTGKGGYTVGLAASAVIVLIATVRLILLPPTVALRGDRNPFSAIRASLAMTKGNTGRLLAFYLLLLIGGLVPAMVIMLLVGTLLALTTSGTLQTSLSDTAYSIVLTGLWLLVAAATAATWRQLGEQREG